jgi:hypothetical protein
MFLTFLGFIFPFMERRVDVGLKPTIPQKAAGILSDPATSLPIASGTHSMATKAASPPDEPPGVRERSQGLRDLPQIRLTLSPNIMV